MNAEKIANRFVELANNYGGFNKVVVARNDWWNMPEEFQITMVLDNGNITTVGVCNINSMVLIKFYMLDCDNVAYYWFDGALDLFDCWCAAYFMEEQYEQDVIEYTGRVFREFANDPNHCLNVMCNRALDFIAGDNTGKLGIRMGVFGISGSVCYQLDKEYWFTSEPRSNGQYIAIRKSNGDIMVDTRVQFNDVDTPRDVVRVAIKLYNMYDMAINE